MARYVVGGKAAATAATADHAIAGVWNASTSKRIKVTEIHAFAITAVAIELVVRRTTARGTPGSTITPTSVNEMEQVANPASGFLLDLAAYTVQPTLAGTTNDLYGTQIPAAIGAGIMFQCADFGIEIPAGSGIALTSRVAAAAQCRVTVVVED